MSIYWGIVGGLVAAKSLRLDDSCSIERAKQLFIPPTDPPKEMHLPIELLIEIEI
jgi:hypothetical protein